jgi:hypothetical protein
MLKSHNQRHRFAVDSRARSKGAEIGARRMLGVPPGSDRESLLPSYQSGKYAGCWGESQFE